MSPGPSACGADVIQLHHVPHEVASQVDRIYNYLGNFWAAPLHAVSLGTICRRGSDAIWVWTHWGSSPGPSTCEADVIPLHHVPHVCSFPGGQDLQLLEEFLGCATACGVSGYHLPAWQRCHLGLDTLGFEPRAFHMRSGCDTTTPHAPCVHLHR